MLDKGYVHVNQVNKNRARVQLRGSMFISTGGVCSLTHCNPLQQKTSFIGIFVLHKKYTYFTHSYHCAEKQLVFYRIVL